MSDSNKVKMEVQLGNLTLKNPIMSASGTFGYGLELEDFVPANRLGALITKGVSLEPWPGNKSPRVVEAAGGLINSIGLENMGVHKFINDVLPKLSETVVGVNILGKAINDYAALAEILSTTDIDFIEVNISCPNVSAGGLTFGADAKTAALVTKEVVDKAGKKPVVVKLTPQCSDIVEVALKVQEAGASAVSLINTIPAMAVNINTRKPEIANVIGGLSGSPIKPVALRQVWLCAKALSIPVIGLGGILTFEDALEFILVGASAVQIGTATFIDPNAALNILNDMSIWLEKNNIKDINEFRGALIL